MWKWMCWPNNYLQPCNVDHMTIDQTTRRAEEQTVRQGCGITKANRTIREGEGLTNMKDGGTCGSIETAQIRWPCNADHMIIDQATRSTDYVEAKYRWQKNDIYSCSQHHWSCKQANREATMTWFLGWRWATRCLTSQVWCADDVIFKSD